MRNNANMLVGHRIMLNLKYCIIVRLRLDISFFSFILTMHCMGRNVHYRKKQNNSKFESRWHIVKIIFFYPRKWRNSTWFSDSVKTPRFPSKLLRKPSIQSQIVFWTSDALSLIEPSHHLRVISSLTWKVDGTSQPAFTSKQSRVYLALLSINYLNMVLS